MEAAIKGLWRCSWRPRLREFGEESGGRDPATVEMHLEAVIEQD